MNQYGKSHFNFSDNLLNKRSGRSGSLLVLAISFMGCLILSPLQSYAQPSDDENLFYIHVGVSLSAVQGGAARGFSKINALGGVGLLMPIEEQWKFGLEGNIVQKGERVFGSSTFQIEEYIADLVYAQVAGYLSYDFSERISAFLGPGIGVLVYKDESARFGSSGSVETEFRTIEVSAVGGVRFVVTDRISLAGRFDQSVLPVKKGSDGVNIAQITGARQYHTVAAFCVEFKF